MSIASEIERIQNAKTSIKTAIENKGVTVGEGTIDTYASKIDEISSGGSGADFEINECSYLFYKKARLEVKDELYKLIDANCENFSYMFYGCDGGIDNFEFSTQNGKNFDYMFAGWGTATEFPVIDTSNGVNFANMYNSCSSATKFPLINTNKGTAFTSMYQSCTKATEFPVIDTSNGVTFDSMYNYCKFMEEAPAINTGNGTNLKSMLANCTYLKTLPEYDFGKANNIQYFFNNSSSLENVGGFKDLGKGYTIKYSNQSSCTLDLSRCSKLTYQSLMDVINKLYDLNLTYDVANGGTLYTQKLVLGSTNMAKLSADEIAIATNKGWVVS